MGVNLSSKLTLDGTQHNSTLKDAVKEVSKYKREVDSANKTLNDFQKASNNVGSSVSSMISSLKSGDILGFANSAKSAASSMTSMIPAAGGASGAITGLGVAIKTALGPIGLAITAIAAIVGVTGAAITTTEDFETSLRGLSALTGVTGDTLDKMGDAAVSLSVKYGEAAKDIVDSMKMIGSQAPQLLSDMAGLNSVTENAMVLQKAADGMTIEDTAKAITTVMNQMNVAASESTNIINTLAAGAQKGAADVLYLTTAIEKSGTQASNAKMTYQQLVGAIETIAPKFSSADVAGTSLNAMLTKLTTQANDNFNPAVVGIEKALDNLAEANLSAADKLKLFGQSGLVAANTLIESRESLRQMTEAVSDTNTAYEQMETKQGSLGESFSKLKSSWDALMISLGQSPIIKTVVNILNAVINAVNQIIQVITRLVQIWNAIWKKIGQGMSDAYHNVIKPVWTSISKLLTDNAVFRGIYKIFKGIYDFIIGTIEKIKGAWNDFLVWLGLRQEGPSTDDIIASAQRTAAALDAAIKEKQQKQEEQQEEEDKKTKTVTTKNKIEFETGSLDELKSKLQELNKLLTSKKLSMIDVEKTKQQIKEIEDLIEQKEIELGLRPKKGSLEAVENEISKLEDKLRKLDPTVDFVEIDKIQVKKEELEKLKKNIESQINGVVVQGERFTSKGAEGSLQYAQDKVAYYKQRIQLEIEGTENYNYLAEKIKEWTAKENKIKLVVEADTSNLDTSSLKYLTDKISYYKAQLDIYAYDSPEYKQALEELRKWTEKENKIKIDIDLDKAGAKDGSLKELETKISDIKAKIKLEVYGTPEYIKLNEELKALEKEEHVIKTRIEVDNMSAFEKLGNITAAFEGIDGVVNSMESLADAVAEGADAWDVFMESISVVEAVITGINTVMQVCNMLTSVGTTAKAANAAASTTAAVAAETEAGAEAASITSKTASTIANKALESSLLDLAAAQIFAAHASIPFAGVGLAGGFIGAMMAAMAAQHAASAALQAYAGGGIIQGKTTVGDYNIARVNAGEMILNQRQQSNLFRALDSGNLSVSNTLTGTVVKIKGSDLYIAFSNMDKTKSKIGKKLF